MYRCMSVLICSVLATTVLRAEEAAPIRILVPMMAQGAVTELEPMLRAKVGAAVKIEYLQMPKLVEQLNNGDRPDVTIVSKATAQQLSAKGEVQSQADLVQSEVGVAVADNAATPVLKTEADFAAFLKAVPSIALYGIGASGALVMRFAEQQGLAEVVKNKATIVTEGFASSLVRDGKVAAAVQQISELKFGGTNNIVPLPESLQVRGGGSSVVVFNATRHPAAAMEAVHVLTSPEASAAYRRAGLKPVFPAAAR